MHARPQGQFAHSGVAGGRRSHCALLRCAAHRQNSACILEVMGMCRDTGVTMRDVQGTDWGGSIMGGVNGMLADSDRDETVARLAAGKKFWRGTKRVEERWPYRQHPSESTTGNAPWSQGYGSNVRRVGAQRRPLTRSRLTESTRGTVASSSANG